MSAETVFAEHAEEVRRLVIEAGIPDHMHKGVIEYVCLGRPIGGFLTAMFACDFKRMCGNADTMNLDALPRYGRLLSVLPGGCHGAYQAVEDWQETGGLKGIYIKDAESAP